MKPFCSISYENEMLLNASYKNESLSKTLIIFTGKNFTETKFYMIDQLLVHIYISSTSSETQTVHTSGEPTCSQGFKWGSFRGTHVQSRF